MEKQINAEELKKLQLEILQTVHDFCEKNDIHYSLCGGTLLGAVRHKGYIPWDDDIDIMMSRPDYERFHRLFNEQEKSSLKVISSLNDAQFFHPFAKLVNTKTFLIEKYDRKIDSMGVNIDIFPLDGLPDDEKKRENYWKKIKRRKFINGCLYQKNSRKEKGIKKLLRRCLFLLFKPLSGNHFAKKINAFAKNNDYFSSRFLACSVFGYGKREQMPKEVFESFVDLDFEGKKFKAMQGYETYLSNIYGDYMQLPPVEKQVAKHDFEVYWR